MEQLTFFKSYYRAAQRMDDSTRLAFYDAILGYAFDGDWPDPESPIFTAFLLVEAPITKSKAKAEAAKAKH